jgi:hypothetical protein
VTFGSMYCVIKKVFVVLCLIVDTIVISVDVIMHNIIIILIVAIYIYFETSCNGLTLCIC